MLVWLWMATAVLAATIAGGCFVRYAKTKDSGFLIVACCFLVSCMLTTFGALTVAGIIDLGRPASSK
jgi:hypothetical protein